ncbi:MAG: PolC-type DNA polymerase III [Clostridia bacterium]|nr:PolC-type DNA polymerase III [Clostridia bacterium]
MSPTNIKLSDMFTGTDIPEILNKAFIFSTNADAANREMAVTLSSSEIIPYGVIEDFKDKIKERFSLNKFILRVKYSGVDINDIDIDLYYSNLIFYVNELIPGVRHIFQDSSAEFKDGVFTIHCKYGTNMLDTMNCKEMLKRLVKSQLSYNADFVFCDDGSSKLRDLKQKTLDKISDFAYKPKENEDLEKTDEPKIEIEETEENRKVILGKHIDATPERISSLLSPDAKGNAVIRGVVTDLDYREIETQKSGKSVLLSLVVADKTCAFTAKAFIKPDIFEGIREYISEGCAVRVQGKIEFDGYTRENVLRIKNIETDEIPDEKKPDVIYGKPISGDAVPIESISPDDSGSVIIRGQVLNPDVREINTKNGPSCLFTFFIADNKSAFSAKMFLKPEKYAKIKGKLKDGTVVKIGGKIQYDNYAKENIIQVDAIVADSMPSRKDSAPVKRVELHMHTKMSQMDAMTDAKTLVKQAIKWGHKAVAITDHGNVQAFPDAMHAAEKSDLKVLYGMECYLVNDTRTIVTGNAHGDLNSEFVVFDIETTGLSAEKDTIIEIGAVKIKNKKIVDKFETFVDPERAIPEKITEITSIKDEDVTGAPKLKDALASFFEFAKGSVLVAHNAGFDTSFIKNGAKQYGFEYNFACADTLELSRSLVQGLKNYKLDTLTKHFEVLLEHHHRACDDAQATGEIFIHLLGLLEEKNISDIGLINTSLSGDVDIKSLKYYHCILIAKNLVGLRNLYELISMSCLEYFYKKPRIPKSILQQKREGLIIGSACEAGELYREILKNPYNPDYYELEKIVNFYDYLEIQPLGNNRFLLNNETLASEDDLKYINKFIIELGKKYGKLTVATCDVHFMNPEDEIFRRILMAGQGYKDADNQPPLYLRTTEEMLKEFEYLGEELAYEVVVENTNKIADMTEKINPVPPDKAPPVIEGSDEMLRKLTYDKAISIYGENMPQLVRDRIDVELNSIINNGYSVLYIIAQKLVWKSNADGYLVGSRGSVGSSLVAFMSGITEVNSLPPHYVCPECKYSEFLSSEDVGSGYDLKPKPCPKCGAMMKADGQDIPFETFLGFSGNKEPDIDLNFSGDYQPVAHKYVEELFGVGHVFRAGTIGTVAAKTAYGYVKKYFDEKGQYISNAQAERLVRGCTGVKRTTGQHPGGIIVVPTARDVHEFSPIQHPADDTSSDIITLHFDYHSIDQNLLKLDILGHDDPTVIRMLEDLTGIDPLKIPMGDEATMSLFLNTDALGVKPEDIDSPVGTFAVPEFGTKFVRQMLVDTKPRTFSELVRISGLSHGTDVWLNNAQDLIREGTTTLSKAICTRDDIMIYLIHHGVANDMAFKIMESVRKGRGLTPEMESVMRENNVPDWYIASCKKIKYMFPKAHAVAYVTMAYRIAYCKVHYPMAFYATYFTVRADDFDFTLMGHGKEKLLENKHAIEAKGQDASDKEKNIITIMEVCNEMYARGIKFVDIDIKKSHATKFIPTEEGLLPPLNALPNLGINAANSITAARDEEDFSSIEDLQQRSKVTKTVIEVLKEAGVLNGMPDSSQLTFF